jgi:hypothetical protein
LTPAADRPYIGGSTDNSILNLIFGYNGLGRLTGNETGSVVGGGRAGASGQWGPTGLTRLFGDDMGSQIAWLLPAALLLGVTVLWLIRRSPRTDLARAQVLLWGSWLVVTGLTFSLGKGIIHPYYTVALAPAIGALVGIGVVALWRSRRLPLSRLVLAVAVAGTAVLAHRLMSRSPDFHPWLRDVVVVLGVVVALAVLVPPTRLGRQARWSSGLAVAALAVGFAGPIAWSINTAATAHAGAIPSAGPAVTVPSSGGPAGHFGFRPRGQLGAGGGLGAPPGFGGGNPFGPGGPLALGGRGGGGNLIQAGTPSAAVIAALRADASAYSWVAATAGGENAAGYQLAAAEPVMAIGGFNGTDPAPSLAQFERFVAQGRIHYFIGAGRSLFGGFLGGGAGGSGGGDDASQIAQWVAANYRATTLGGTTLYDLTPTSDSAVSS